MLTRDHSIGVQLQHIGYIRRPLEVHTQHRQGPDKEDLRLLLHRTHLAGGRGHESAHVCRERRGGVQAAQLGRKPAPGLRGKVDQVERHQGLFGVHLLIPVCAARGGHHSDPSAHMSLSDQHAHVRGQRAHGAIHVEKSDRRS